MKIFEYKGKLYNLVELAELTGRSVPWVEEHLVKTNIAKEQRYTAFGFTGTLKEISEKYKVYQYLIVIGLNLGKNIEDVIRKYSTAFLKTDKKTRKRIAWVINRNSETKSFDTKKQVCSYLGISRNCFDNHYNSGLPVKSGWTVDQINRTE